MVDSGSVNLMGDCISGESFIKELKFLDFPLDCVEENAHEEEEEEEEESEDWNANLQSTLGLIPFDFLSRCLHKNIVNGASDLVLNDSETLTDEGGLELIQPPHLIEETSNAKKPKSVQSLSPILVLKSSNSCIPKRARSRSSINKKWSSIVIVKYFNTKKKRKIPKRKAHFSGENVSLRRCSHCQVTHTPQWREGPMGSKTLCNACGVWYRSRRHFPEYRPMASPGFVPSLHSNSHKKVLEMRN